MIWPGCNKNLQVQSIWGPFAGPVPVYRLRCRIRIWRRRWLVQRQYELLQGDIVSDGYLLSLQKMSKTIRRFMHPGVKTAKECYALWMYVCPRFNWDCLICQSLFLNYQIARQLKKRQDLISSVIQIMNPTSVDCLVGFRVDAVVPRRVLDLLCHLCFACFTADWGSA